MQPIASAYETSEFETYPTLAFVGDRGKQMAMPMTIDPAAPSPAVPEPKK
jgi:hypothetical protein